MTNWTEAAIEALFNQPFNDLVYDAHRVHRQYFDPNKVEAATLLSIKTGACPEDCAYCPQSLEHDTGLEKEKLMPLEAVVCAAKKAKESGATRFCMGAAWRNAPSGPHFERTKEMIKAVKELGLETCFTMGMLNQDQADELKQAGLDYYNHNIDTSPEYYEKIITTRTYQERLNTLSAVSKAGVKVCCGGIVGMGETRQDRVRFLLTLTELESPPESVPINRLIRVKGTPLEDAEEIDDLEFVRTIAVARIIFPKAVVRLSAGREAMPDTMQALCFFAGANSLFYGDKLLTTANPNIDHDLQLFDKLGIEAGAAHAVTETS